MDASASRNADARLNDVLGFIIKIDGSNFPHDINPRNTIIKYTKLPQFDIDPKVSGPRNSYVLPPRLRRIITVDDSDSKTTRSLKPDLLEPPKKMALSVCKRKFVSLTEDDEYNGHPRFIATKKTNPVSNKSDEVNFADKAHSQRVSPQPYHTLKYSKDSKQCIKPPNSLDGSDKNSIKSKQIKNVTEYSKAFNRDKELIRSNKSVNSSKTSVRKKNVMQSESEKEVIAIKSKLYDNVKNVQPKRNTVERSRMSRSTPLPNNEKKRTSAPYNTEKTNITRSSFSYHKEFKSKQLPVIHVPIENNNCEPKVSNEMLSSSLAIYPRQSDCTNETDTTTYKNSSVCTEPPPQKVDHYTDIDNFENEMFCDCVHRTEVFKETLDSLHIPNVTLTKDKNNCKDESFKLHSKSLPNLKIPSSKITPHKDENRTIHDNYFENTSYIISRATLTYTTKQKINLEVVGSKDNAYSNHSPSPLSYPMNVVSVYNNEIKSTHFRENSARDDKKRKDNAEKQLKNCLNELKSLNSSYDSNSNKLMKPSDIISTIRVNNGLSQSDYICEQFQRELNFIDSFFESLQYLESCSLSDTCLVKNDIDSLVKNIEFDEKNSGYDNLLSKLENGESTTDTETITSKNLFLLNILIRDEQRRAKNLLFVLKKREDALKDFTKSQILYLENKKKKGNTDISALKKKQRGALLKLQHECGEMQRMRKALLTLSEKRKVALMRTKKDLELKLRSNVSVEHIILGKKKVKRNTGTDRAAPLKCFDLSSSGGDDSTNSHPNSEVVIISPVTQTSLDVVESVKPVTSAEKSIQTGDSILENAGVDQSIHTTEENNVAVDGLYLNILFHNLSLPQIFSGGKQYEVNQEAIKNIVNSTTKNNVSGTDVDKLMEHIESRDLDRSSTPSTARSLVEELVQYYKVLTEEEKITPYPVLSNETTVSEVTESMVGGPALEDTYARSYPSTDTLAVICESNETIVYNDKICISNDIEERKNVEMSPTGPLPVPAGAAATSDIQLTDTTLILPSPTLSDSSVSSQSQCGPVSSMCSLAAPVDCEAEELRRQQLAIEKEIKELEQQQSRLLVVREIPDKPPPPYTPPVDTRLPVLPRSFKVDHETNIKINNYLHNPHATADSNDPFDLFVLDFCQETIDRHKLEQSDKPWDACNLLPPKPTVDVPKLVSQTSTELAEVLAGVEPTVLSGVSSRRSDHIDDILFAEWRRVEPSWTSLQADEAIVKNQIFESIFQKILNDTVDEYKRTVQCENDDA